MCFPGSLLWGDDWRKTRYKLASKFTQPNSVNSSVYAYARCPLIDNAKSFRNSGVCALLVDKLLDTIYLSMDLFSNDISPKYISSSIDSKADVGIYALCCLHYIFIDQN